MFGIKRQFFWADYRVMTSWSVFLFLTLSLIIPSGYSYGAICLLLLSLSLFMRGERVKLYKNDWIILSIIFIFFIAHILINIFHSLPLTAYDNLSRFLIAIPVFILLIAYPPNKNFFFVGLMFGMTTSGLLAYYQKYYGGSWRPGGYLNSIQFGDIALLMFCLGFVSLQNVKGKIYYLSVLLSLPFGLTAALLSWSRGGWLAIPLVLIVLYISLPLNKKVKVLRNFGFVAIFFVLGYVLLPDSNLFKYRIIETQQEFRDYAENNLRTTSLSSRMQMWKSGFHAFKERPVLGWGDLSSIKLYFQSDWVILNKNGDYNHLHNEYIDTLAKRGLIGFMALILIYLVPLSLFYKNITHENSDIRTFALMGVCHILCIMAFGLTQTFLAHTSGTMIFVFTLIIIWSLYREALSCFEVNKL